MNAKKEPSKEEALDHEFRRIAREVAAHEQQRLGLSDDEGAAYERYLIEAQRRQAQGEPSLSAPKFYQEKFARFETRERAHSKVQELRPADPASGGEFDATTGSQYNRDWQHDSQAGGELSKEPVELAGDPSNIKPHAGNRPTNGTDPSGLKDFQELPPGMTGDEVGDAIAEAERQAKWLMTFGTPLASKLLAHFADGTGTDYVLTGSDLGRVMVSSKFKEMKGNVTVRFKGHLVGATLTTQYTPFNWKSGRQVITYPKPSSLVDRSWDADMFYSFHNIYADVYFVGKARRRDGKNEWDGTIHVHVSDRYEFVDRKWHPIPGLQSTTDDLYWLWQEYGGAKGFNVYGEMEFRDGFTVTPLSGASPASSTFRGSY